MTAVIVLNASYEELHRVTVKKAIKMLVREVAVIEESVPGLTVEKPPESTSIITVDHVLPVLREESPPGRTVLRPAGCATGTRQTGHRSRPVWCCCGNRSSRPRTT